MVHLFRNEVKVFSELVSRRGNIQSEERQRYVYALRQSGSHPSRSTLVV
jgi:hypothetical protein